MKRILALLVLLAWNSWALAEAEPQYTATVANTIDASPFNVGDSLRMGLGTMLQSTGSLTVQLVDYTFAAVTVEEVAKAFSSIPSDLILFAHIEKESLSVLLLAKERPTSFIVASRRLDYDSNGQTTIPHIESKFVEAVNSVLSDYNAGTFQPLPGSQNQVAVAENEHNSRKADEARALYRELASLERETWYGAANIGMARFSQTDTSGKTNAVSNVDFGTVGGYRLNSRFAFEAGFDVFTHLLAHSEARYHIPFMNKYIDLSITGGVAKILGKFTRSAASGIDDSLSRSVLFGPGLAFDAPLLGAIIRAEARYYLGQTSVMVATYGVLINF